MPGFDEIQRLLTKYVAQTTTASPEIQTQTYQESYEERYFFDLLSRTKARSKVREFVAGGPSDCSTTTWTSLMMRRLTHTLPLRGREVRDH